VLALDTIGNERHAFPVFGLAGVPFEIPREFDLWLTHSPPWIDPTVTTCREGKPPRDIPDGKVLTSSGKLIDA
jgi:hypothetical protein